MVKAIGLSVLMFFVGMIIWLVIDYNPACRAIYSSECDLPAGAWILGLILAGLTFLSIITGVYDKANKKKPYKKKFRI